MKRYLPYVIFALFGLFVAMFVGRLVYGYTEVVPRVFEGIQNQVLALSESGLRKSNYASIKYKRQAEGAPAPLLVDQKYERVAETKCRTKTFDEDEARTREAIKNERGLIQYEQRQGRKGGRRIDLSVGVPPENFDSLYAELQKIGRVVSTSITKTDKTNEYLDLKAKRASLEANLASLSKLKSRPGSIDALIKLEERMLDVQQKLQGLGVSLGAFDAENEFNTIRFVLIERAERTITFAHRVKVAFEWTVQYYVGLMAGLAFALLASVLLIFAIDRGHRLWSRLQ